MPRFAKPNVTKEELFEAIEKEILRCTKMEFVEDDDFDDDDIYDEADFCYVLDYNPQIRKDFKIDVSFENSDLHIHYPDIIKSKLFTDKGLTYFFGRCGGDGEMPVYFCVYLDPKSKIRVYIPSDGNFYDKKNKCAIEGQSRYGEEVYNVKEMKADILKRIELA